jgi:hypothetical protein
VTGGLAADAAHHPEVFAAYEANVDEAWGSETLPPGPLELCQFCLTQLLGVPTDGLFRLGPEVDGLEQRTARLARWTDYPSFSSVYRACLAFAEQFLLDVQALEEATAAAGRDLVGDAGHRGRAGPLRGRARPSVGGPALPEPRRADEPVRLSRAGQLPPDHRPCTAVPDPSRARMLVRVRPVELTNITVGPILLPILRCDRRRWWELARRSEVVRRREVGTGHGLLGSLRHPCARALLYGSHDPEEPPPAVAS